MTEPNRYAAAGLRAFCARAMERAGARAGDAGETAEGLVAADLRGVHSHGVLRLGIYVDRLRAGSIDPAAELETLRDSGAVLVVDAHAGPGIAMASRAMALAIERARRGGIGVVSVRNANHCGMLAHFAMRALREGMIGLAASNADSQVAPYGARAKFLGTNPLALAIPARDEPPVVLDMATSVVAHGKVKGAFDRGEAIPPDWAVDSAGLPTRDPAQALAGALLAFGGAKGSALSIAIDLLAGVLPGGRSGPEIVPLYQRLDEPQGVGQLFAALRVDETVRRIRALPTAAGVARVLLPGELEHARASQREADGIPLPADAVAELARVAELLEFAAPVPMTRAP
jgi:ureidoglycolate dehydrogenase (NAD+)